MNIFESIRTSLGAIASNKLRSSLTMLGIIIGVGAVIALSSAGQGVESMVAGNLEDIGSNLIYLIPQQPEDATGPVHLTMRDVQALGNPLDASAIADLAPEVSGRLSVSYDDINLALTVVGTTERLDTIRNLRPEIGGFLTRMDLDEQARVVVLGWEAYTELFDDGIYPIDKSVFIDGTRFRVVGVLEQKGGMIGQDANLYVPITTSQSRLHTQRTLAGEYPVSSISVAVIDETMTDAATEQITAILREQHDISAGDEDDFEIISQQQVLEMSSQITGTLTTFLAVIAGISLLVGGIGIMNIMLVTVTERTREIGIRKAVGATPVAILIQFLIESLVLTLVGGSIGILLGVGAANVLSGLMSITPEVTVGMLGLATGISSAIGLVFGVYPAMRAAQLHPIQALRYE